jgi:Cu/Ag efflux protein CusF
MKIPINTMIAAFALVLAMPLATAAGADMTEGEVRKIDKEAGKLTLRHAEIKSLDMPAMTMVFTVKDKAVLDKLQPGDKVRFKATNDGGKFTVTEIEVSK